MVFPHQADEDVLERALRRLQVAEPDVGAGEVVEQRGDAGALALGVVGVDQLLAARRQRELVAREVVRDRVERVVQLQRELLLAELVHQLGLALDQDDLALVDDADAVGHLLGFFDVVRGEDDGDAGGAQRAHHVPHVLAQLDVDAGGRLVEEQHLRLVRERLGDQHAPLHAAGQRHDLGVLLVPQRERAQHLLDVAGIGRQAEQPAAERDRRPHRLERVGVELLRHQADQRAGGAIVGEDVMAADRDRAGRRRHDPADDADQRGLAGAVRPEQRENLALVDVEVDALERLEPGGIGLRQVGDRNDRGHGET